MSRIIAIHLAFFLCAIAIPATAQTTTVSGIIDYDESKAIVRTINKARREKGLNTLKMEQGLTEAAMLRAAEFSIQCSPLDKRHIHISEFKRPNGKPFNTLIEEKYAMPQGTKCGEFIYCCVNCKEWMSIYRKGLNEENIVLESWNSVGAAVFYHDEYAYCVIFFSKHTNGNTAIPSGLWKTKFQVGTTSGKKTYLSTKEQSNAFEPPHKVDYNGSFYYDFATEVVRLVNIIRDSLGIEPLAMDSTMTECAMLRAAEISSSEGYTMNSQIRTDYVNNLVKANVTGHSRPNGKDALSVLTQEYAETGTEGENVARGQQTPQEVVNGWMNSPGHRSNILKKNYKTIGVGAFYNGRQLCWVQLFTSVSNTNTYHPYSREDVTVQIALTPDTESKVVKRNQIQ